MKKKIIIGAIALMGVFGGLTAWQSFSGQNEVKANCIRDVCGGSDGNCFDCTCYAGYGGVGCTLKLAHQF